MNKLKTEYQKYKKNYRNYFWEKISQKKSFPQKITFSLNLFLCAKEQTQGRRLDKF